MWRNAHTILSRDDRWGHGVVSVHLMPLLVTQDPLHWSTYLLESNLDHMSENKEIYVYSRGKRVLQGENSIIKLMSSAFQ